MNVNVTASMICFEIKRLKAMDIIKKAGPFLIEDSEMGNRRVGEGERHSSLQRTCNNGQMLDGRLKFRSSVRGVERDREDDERNGFPVIEHVNAVAFFPLI